MEKPKKFLPNAYWLFIRPLGLRTSIRNYGLTLPEPSSIASVDIGCGSWRYDLLNRDLLRRSR